MILLFNHIKFYYMDKVSFTGTARNGSQLKASQDKKRRKKKAGYINCIGNSSKKANPDQAT